MVEILVVLLGRSWDLFGIFGMPSHFTGFFGITEDPSANSLASVHRSCDISGLSELLITEDLIKTFRDSFCRGSKKDMRDRSPS